jgi:hypothetical protein
MTKERFDQFKNKILALSGDAEVFWEEIKALQTTKEKAIRLVREQKYLLDVRKEELQQAKIEVKNFKSHLQEALKKIKQLEGEKLQNTPAQPIIKEAPSNDVDLEKIANDFDWKLEKQEEEKRFKYYKKMDFGL